METKRYKNGDRCPCCGQVIEGKSEEWLELFSLTAALFFEATGEEAAE